jgi:hypothetical protein
MHFQRSLTEDSTECDTRSLEQLFVMDGVDEFAVGGESAAARRGLPAPEQAKAQPMSGD